MANLEDVLKRINEYDESFRKDEFRENEKTRLDISKVYKLFPDPDNEDEFGWPKTWPNHDRQGVYLILDDQLVLLYVGKVSMSNTFGARLSSYFSYEDDKKTCKVNNKWSNDPKYVVTIAVPKGMSFEAPALEEYLLMKMGKDELPDNTIKGHMVG